jgi:hypothetical protein
MMQAPSARLSAPSGCRDETMVMVECRWWGRRLAVRKPSPVRTSCLEGDFSDPSIYVISYGSTDIFNTLIESYGRGSKK